MQKHGSVCFDEEFWTLLIVNVVCIRLIVCETTVSRFWLISPGIPQIRLNLLVKYFSTLFWTLLQEIGCNDFWKVNWKMLSVRGVYKHILILVIFVNSCDTQYYDHHSLLRTGLFQYHPRLDGYPIPVGHRVVQTIHAGAYWYQRTIYVRIKNRDGLL